MEIRNMNKIVIHASNISGHGTFATANIANDEFIVRLEGERVPLSEGDRISCERGFTIDDPLQIEEETVIIVEGGMRIVNHSCDPNAGIRKQNDLYAIKEISNGDEITFDYSTTVGTNVDWQMVCRCGSMNCRGIIGNVTTLPPERLQYYREHKVLPDFILRQLKLDI